MPVEYEEQVPGRRAAVYAVEAQTVDRGERWSGTRTDGQAFEMRGVTRFEIAVDVIVAGRLYLEDVERELIGIDEVVETLSGHRPHTAGP